VISEGKEERNEKICWNMCILWREMMLSVEFVTAKSGIE